MWSHARITWSPGSNDLRNLRTGVVEPPTFSRLMAVLVADDVAGLASTDAALRPSRTARGVWGPCKRTADEGFIAVGPPGHPHCMCPVGHSSPTRWDASSS